MASGKYGGHHKMRIGDGLSFKLAFFAVSAIDFESGNLQKARCLFPLKCLLMLLSFLIYNTEIAVRCLVRVMKRAEMSIIVSSTQYAMHLMFWWSIITRSRKMRQLLRKICCAQKRVGGQIRRTKLKNSGLQITVILLTVGFLPFDLILKYVNNEIVMNLNNYGVMHTFRDDDHPMVLISSIIMIRFLTSMTHLVLQNSFILYNMCVYYETKELLMSLRIQSEDNRNVIELFSKYQIITEVVDEADELMNFPAALFVAKAFGVLIVGIMTLFGLETICTSFSNCIAFGLFFSIITVSNFMMVKVAADYNEEGNRLKSAVRSNLSVYCMSKQHRGREEFFIETVERREFSYSGWKMFNFTRSFTLSAVGTMLTYALLIVQLRKTTESLPEGQCNAQ